MVKDSTFQVNFSDKTSPLTPNGMEWNKLLGLSPSVLGGGTDGFPQLPPGPGQQLTENS